MGSMLLYIAYIDPMGKKLTTKKNHRGTKISWNWPSKIKSSTKHTKPRMSVKKGGSILHPQKLRFTQQGVFHPYQYQPWWFNHEGQQITKETWPSFLDTPVFRKHAHDGSGWCWYFSMLTFTLWWTNIAIENGPVEIVDFPIKNGDFPLLCKRSPEGKPPFSYGFPIVFLWFSHFPMVKPLNVDGNHGQVQPMASMASMASAPDAEPPSDEVSRKDGDGRSREANWAAGKWLNWGNWETKPINIPQSC